MKPKNLLLYILLISVLMVGIIIFIYEKEEYLRDDVLFVAYTGINPHEIDEMLSDVSIVIIDSHGEVVDVLTTDKDGEVKTELTIPVDKKYLDKSPDAMKKRGTITAIAYKEGYCSAILFEVPVNSSVQHFYMIPEVPGKRNEPIEGLGNTHHLQIIKLVEKYSKYKD